MTETSILQRFSPTCPARRRRRHPTLHDPRPRNCQGSPRIGRHTPEQRVYHQPICCNIVQSHAFADGFRDSSQSWADLLRSCRRRGMTASLLGVGDGALSFWKALREVFPDTRERRCWFHVSSNVCAALPKSAHPGAKAALAEIYNAEDKAHALNAVKAFDADYGAKWPKAVAKITERVDVLLAFYDYPAQHWIHLRTTNPIESTFATVRLRQRITKGPGSRAAGVAMAFKLIESAQARWRAVNAPHLVALVRAGATFINGKLIERPGENAEPEAA
jgi:putative transposase